MPKQSRTVAAMMHMQQTKMAAETTSRYTVAQNFEKLASMIWAGPQRLFDRRSQVGDGHQGSQQEDAADDEGTAHRGEHGLGRLAPRVVRLLGECRGGVEAVDHEQAHEHRREERAEADVQSAAVASRPRWAGDGAR